MAEKFRDLTGGHGFVDEAGNIHKIDPKFLSDNKLVMNAQYVEADDKIIFYNGGEEYTPDWDAIGLDAISNGCYDYAIFLVTVIAPNATMEMCNLVDVDAGDAGAKSMTFMTARVSDETPELHFIYAKKNADGWSVTLEKGSSDSNDVIEVVFPDGLWAEIKDANYDLNKFDVTLSKKDKTPIEVVKYNDLLEAFKAGKTIHIYLGNESDSFYELEGKKGVRVYG